MPRREIKKVSIEGFDMFREQIEMDASRSGL